MNKRLTGWGYSDDCAGFSGLKASEYDVPDTWYPLLLGEKRVGRIRMFYDGRVWEVQMEGDEAAFTVGQKPIGKKKAR